MRSAIRMGGNRRRASLLVAGAFLLAGMLASMMPATGATSGTVVGATVPSAVAIDATGCATGTPNVTSFGNVLPGATVATGADCVLKFGSSNTTSSLRIRQADGAGIAMFGQTDAALDLNFDGGVNGNGVFRAVSGAGSQHIPSPAITTGGRIRTAYTCDNGGSPEMCVIEIDQTGTRVGLDGDGAVTLAISTVAESVYSSTVDDANRSVLGGTCQIAALTHPCFARMLPNGTLDPAFGTGGVTILTGANGGGVSDLVLAPNGDIVGHGGCSNASAVNVCVYRVNDGGTPVQTFGTNGISQQYVRAGASEIHYVTSLDLASDGTIMSASYCSDSGATLVNSCLLKLSSTGSRDLTFSGDGRYEFELATGGSNQDALSDVQRLPDGSYLVLATCDSAANGFRGCVAKVTSAGLVDGSWASGNRVIEFGAGAANDFFLAIVPDGSGFLVVGQCDTSGSATMHPCVARLTSTGALDTGFSGDGLQQYTDPFPSQVAIFNDTTVTPSVDGRLLITATCDGGGGNPDVCMAQLSAGASTYDYSFGVDDFSDTTQTVFGVCQSSVTSAAATWAVQANCPATDGTYWHGVPTASTVIATAASGEQNAYSRLRFGLHVAPARPPSDLQAPVFFEVTAP